MDFDKLMNVCVAIGFAIIGIYLVGYVLSIVIPIVFVSALALIFVFAAVCSKVRIPLVNPNGPLFVPVTYCVLWAIVVTFGLALTTDLIRSWWPDFSRASAAKNFEGEMASFFLSILGALLASVKASRAYHAEMDPRSRWQIGIVQLAVVAVAFSTRIRLGSPSLLFTGIAEDVWSMVAAPMSWASLAASPGDLPRMLLEWLRGAGFSLFEISKHVGNVLWVYMIAKGLFEWVFGYRPDRDPSEEHANPVDPQLSPEEWKIFGVTMLSAITGMMWPLVFAYAHGFNTASMSDRDMNLIGFPMLLGNALMVWMLVQSRAYIRE